jgi:hypothetical protein
MNPYLLDIQPLHETPHLPLRSYFVSSTAPVNVEQPPKSQNGGDPQVMIEEMAAFIEAHSQKTSAAPGVELIIQIHGYNTNPEYVKGWYYSNCEYMAQHYPPTDRARIMICYHWPSEPMGKMLKDSIQIAQEALPRLLRLISRSSKFGAIIALIGLVFGLLLVLHEGVRFLVLLLLFMILLVAAIVFIMPVLTLLGLRVSNYFRDTHRATNYGVADLIELIRQLDATLMRRAQEQKRDKPLIKLSFIGHSMGAFVITQTIRVLSDVFDQRSIATLDLNQRTLPPSSEIGNVYCLGRLILVAPDISAESIISGRGNTLRSSLRRFEEAYMFSNEGDLALRIASTVANYFSFPTYTQEGGHRLGTVMVRQPDCEGARTERYGILNQVNGKLVDRKAFLDYLRIRPDCTLRQRQEGIWGCPVLTDDSGKSLPRKPIAELFTYFDCTDYVEMMPDPNTQQLVNRGVLGLAEGKYSLGLWDYIRLIKLTLQNKLDPHGGYIFRSEARFVKRLIYGLGCVGFAGLLQNMESEAECQQYLLDIQTSDVVPSIVTIQQKRTAQSLVLSNLCKRHQLQVLLSPERNCADILTWKPDRQGY